MKKGTEMIAASKEVKAIENGQVEKVNKPAQEVKAIEEGEKPATGEPAKMAISGNEKVAKDLAPLREKLNGFKPMIRPEDRFNRLELFSQLKKKYEFLKLKDHEIKNFAIGQDGAGSKITLTTQTGGEVIISNPDVMKEVVTLCGKTITELLEQAESEVLEFSI